LDSPVRTRRFVYGAVPFDLGVYEGGGGCDSMVSAGTQHSKILIGAEQVLKCSYIFGIRPKIKMIAMSKSHIISIRFFSNKTSLFAENNEFL
jgi:hypothetical protein